MPNRYKKTILLLGDITLFVCSIVLMVLIDVGNFSEINYLKNHLIFAAILTPTWTTIFFIEGLYSLRTFNKNGLVVSLLRASIFSTIGSVGFLYLFGPMIGITPKTNLLIFSSITFFLVYLWRIFFFKIFSYKVFTREVLFIGKSSIFSELENLFQKKKYLGFKVTNKITCIKEFTPNFKERLIVIDDSHLNSTELASQLFELLNRGAIILSLSEFSEVVSGKIPLDSINHRWFIDAKVSLSSGPYYFLKSMFDRSVAALGILLCLPIFLFLIPLLLITSGRPILYSQRRVGLNNKNYTIYKLRSMTINAEKDGAQWSQKGDARVTKMGNFLRTTRLDEIPQLWNVINGSMSLVGPRPERPEIIQERLENIIPFYNYRHLVKPGVTGWAQVNYGYGSSQHDSLVKLQFDLYYIKNRSIWLDLRIILKTIKTVISRIGR